MVTSGKDRGKSGAVVRTFVKTTTVIVEGVNIVTHHEKSRRRGQRGQIVTRPAPVHVSNVALLDPKSKKPVRVGYVIEGEGKKAKKVRVYRPSGTKV